MNFEKIGSAKEAECYLADLFETLVPSEGKCENMAGELVRAINRIVYRYYNDGEKIGVGYGKETCNAAARFIRDNATETEIKTAIRLAWDCPECNYEKYLNRIMLKLSNYLKAHYNTLVNTETKDMFDYFDEEEDRDDSFDDEDDYDEDDE